ncbi:MAG: hypothetical protein CFH41_01292 [Alphaproteobacteria bacterium MarineAlpha11_Bin1]|nr:MAG: hypothetical protein CFH41_01292 [Alphaproteobacteria bacterium MarineAlpha11_Bin1]
MLLISAGFAAENEFANMFTLRREVRGAEQKILTLMGR